MKVFLVVLSAVLSINTYASTKCDAEPVKLVQVTAVVELSISPIVVCYEASVTLPDSVCSRCTSVVALGGEKFDDSGSPMMMALIANRKMQGPTLNGLFFKM